MTSNSALALDLEQYQMTIESDLLGPLDIAPEEVYHFPHGLFGFPDCHGFVLVGAQRPGLYWLQSTEYATLTFLLVDPFVQFEGYSLDLAPADMRDLQVTGSADALLLAIVTLPANRTDPPTANLQGPIAFNVRSRLAKQVVLENGTFGTRCPFAIDQPETAA